MFSNTQRIIQLLFLALQCFDFSVLLLLQLGDQLCILGGLPCCLSSFAQEWEPLARCRLCGGLRHCYVKLGSGQLWAYHWLSNFCHNMCCWGDCKLCDWSVQGDDLAFKFCYSLDKLHCLIFCAVAARAFHLLNQLWLIITCLFKRNSCLATNTLVWEDWFVFEHKLGSEFFNLALELSLDSGQRVVRPNIDTSNNICIVLEGRKPTIELNNMLLEW